VGLRQKRLWVREHQAARWHLAVDAHGHVFACGVVIPGSPFVALEDDQKDGHPCATCLLEAVDPQPKGLVGGFIDRASADALKAALERVPPRPPAIIMSPDAFAKMHEGLKSVGDVIRAGSRQGKTIGNNDGAHPRRRTWRRPRSGRRR
jgi:hypothetical protein